MMKGVIKNDFRDLGKYLGKTVELEAIYVNTRYEGSNQYSFFTNIKLNGEYLCHHLSIPIKQSFVDTLVAGNVYKIKGIVGDYQRKVYVDGIPVSRKDYNITKVIEVNLCNKSILINDSDVSYLSRHKKTVEKLLHYVKVLKKKEGTIEDFESTLSDLIGRIDLLQN